METISGKVNLFKFIGTFNKEDLSFTQEVPVGADDFIFFIDEDGTAYVETSQQ